MLVRVDVNRLMHKNEPRMRTSAARREGFSIYACDLMRLSMTTIVCHTVNSGMRNCVAGFVFSCHMAVVKGTRATPADYLADRRRFRFSDICGPTSWRQ